MDRIFVSVPRVRPKIFGVTLLRRLFVRGVAGRLGLLSDSLPVGMVCEGELQVVPVLEHQSNSFEDGPAPSVRLLGKRGLDRYDCLSRNASQRSQTRLIDAGKLARTPNHIR